ncbi:MAG: acyltransferase family protein [Prevotella sp.]|nr:acyltransferase family protein [Prevotella sp.]
MNENAINQAVALLRFPLMVGIVCIHTDLRIACPITGTLPIFGSFIYVFKNDICFPVLDVFFFIAGFYFFKECRFDRALYATKLRKRCKSLLIPYLLWNGMTFVAVCLCQILTGFMPLLRKSIMDFHWYDYLLVFWDKQLVTGIPSDFHGPLMMQFWFVQCLMVSVLLSPLLWLGVKRLGWLFVVLLGVLLVIYPYREYAGIKMDAFFFFVMGAYFRLHKRLWGVLAHPWMLALCWIALWFAMQFVPELSILYCTTYVLLVLSVACVWKDKCTTILNLQSTSFFIFAFHAFISQAFFDVYAKLSIHWNDPLAFFVFFATVATNVCICLLVYGIMKKSMPKFLAILIGGR